MLRRHHRTLGPSERPPLYSSGGAVDKAYNSQSATERDTVPGGTSSSLVDADSSGEYREHTREPQTGSTYEIECLQDNMNSTRTPATHSSSREQGDRRSRSRRHWRQPEDDVDENKHRRRRTESDLSIKPEKRSHGSVRRKTKKEEDHDKSRLPSKYSSPRKGSITARATDPQAGPSSRRGSSGTSKPNEAAEPAKRRKDSVSRSVSTKHHSLPTSTRKSSSSDNRHTPKAPSRELKSNVTSSRQVVPKESPSKKDQVKRSQSTAESKKAPTFFRALFRRAHSPVPEKKVTCLTCLSDDIPVSRSARLACNHRMCHRCLKRIFTMSVTDPQHMPPRCCTSDHIPLRHVDNLFDLQFKIKWNRKYEEYTTKNRIYCPLRGCGEWISPSNIHTEAGRKYGKCSRCRTKVCCTCNGKWHRGKDCPKDEDTNNFIEIAQKEGWQKCYNCSAMVELKEGCNHMTCRCTAEFCMICGAKWKSCECPWFNYQAGEDGGLHRLNIQEARELYEDANENAEIHRPLREQQEIDRRRQQEEVDELLARRWQQYLDELDGSEDNALYDIHDAANNRRVRNSPHANDPAEEEFAPITFQDDHPTVRDDAQSDRAVPRPLNTRRRPSVTPPPSNPIAADANGAASPRTPQRTRTTPAVAPQASESPRRRRRPNTSSNRILPPDADTSPMARVEQWRRSVVLPCRYDFSSAHANISTRHL